MLLALRCCVSSLCPPSGGRPAIKAMRRIVKRESPGGAAAAAAAAESIGRSDDAESEKRRRRRRVHSEGDRLQRGSRGDHAPSRHGAPPDGKLGIILVQLDEMTWTGDE